MRKAFVGLSGPAFFDFQNSAPKTAQDVASSPNPILDSPAALILMYDEIWFLCRSMCPTSMRELPFVHFVIESPLSISGMAGFTFNDEADRELVDELNRYSERRDFFDHYDSNILGLGASWWRTKGSAIDNHTHRIDLSLLGLADQVAANSTDVRCLLFDQALVNHLGGGLELVTNAFMQEILAPVTSDGSLARSLTDDVPLVDAIVLHGLPTRLTRIGPDVHFLGELRENGCLPDFRKWIEGYSDRVSPAELRNIQDDVAAEIKKHEASYYKKFDPAEFSKSTYKTVLTEGIGLFIPGFSKVMKLAKSCHDYQEVKIGRWSAFIGRARQLAAGRT